LIKTLQTSHNIASYNTAIITHINYTAVVVAIGNFRRILLIPAAPLLPCCCPFQLPWGLCHESLQHLLLPPAGQVTVIAVNVGYIVSIIPFVAVCRHFALSFTTLYIGIAMLLISVAETSMNILTSFK
jgi:hypothetical protein